MSNPNTPVLVGVGQFGHRIESLGDALEPVDMMFEACIRAEKDTGVGGVLQQAQSVRVVRGMWRYNNPAKLIAGRIGAPGAQTVGTLVGGNQNQALMNQTAASILAGELDLVLITGAENGYSSGKARRAGVALSERDAPGQYNLLFGSAQKPEHHEFEVAKGIRQAIQVYPMYDNAIRHHRGETINEHLVRISQLWSRFNEVAQGNSACVDPPEGVGRGNPHARAHESSSEFPLHQADERQQFRGYGRGVDRVLDAQSQAAGDCRGAMGVPACRRGRT